jgi:hypothetical protein
MKSGLLSLAFLALLSAFLAAPASACDGVGFSSFGFGGYGGGCGFQQPVVFSQFASPYGHGFNQFNQFGFAPRVFSVHRGFNHGIAFDRFNNFGFHRGFNGFVFGGHRNFVPARRGFSLSVFR